MPDKQVGIDLSGEKAERVLDGLQQKANQLLSTLQALGSAMGGGSAGPMDRANFFTTLEQHSAVVGAISAARESIGGGGTVSQSVLMNGAGIGASAFAPPARNRQIADPQSIMDSVAGLGLSASAVSQIVGSLASGSVPMAGGSMSAQAVVQQVVASAQMAQMVPSGPFSNLANGAYQANAYAMQFGPGFVPGLNPYAGASPSGPASPIGQPGVQKMVFDFEQQQQRQQQWMVAGAAVGYMGVSAANNFLQTDTQAIITGRRDPLADARNAGSVAGGLVGGALGFILGGPLGLAAGLGAGGSLGSSVAQWLTAPEVMRNEIGVSLLPAVGMTTHLRNGGDPIDVGPRGFYDGRATAAGPQKLQGRGYNTLRVQNWSEAIQKYLLSNSFGGNDQLAASQPEIVNAYSSAVSGLISGGVDPTVETGMLTIEDHPYMKYFHDFDAPSALSGGFSTPIAGGGEHEASFGGATRPRFTLTDNLRRLAGKAIAMTAVNYRGKEDLAETLTRRMAARYGKSAPDIMKSIEPVLASLPDTGGGNYADVLTRFGPEITQRAADAFVGDGEKPDVELRQLMEVSSRTRIDERGVRLGALQARGGGVIQMAALLDSAKSIASLPEGKDSEAYASVMARARQARDVAYNQLDTVNYSIPATHLEGMRDRANLLPFSPANVFSIDLQSARLNSQQIGVLQGRLSNGMASGQLSESGQLELTQKIEQLETQNAQMVAHLSSGMENRLPAMSAGRPGYFGRYNSFQLASLNLNLMGSANRSFGAINGRQVQHQDDFIRSFGMDPHDVAPHTTTSAMNSGGGQLSTVLNRLTDVLNKLASGGVRSTRPSETTGAAAGALGSKDLGLRTAYGSAN